MHRREKSLLKNRLQQMLEKIVHKCRLLFFSRIGSERFFCLKGVA